MDSEKREAELIEAEQESIKRIQQIRLLRIQTALLQGNIDDAESIAASMPDRTEADQAIEKFKETYADTPHGQWKGAANTS